MAAAPTHTVASSHTMRAVVVAEPDGEWRLENRSRPDVGPNDVLVRVRACAICGTDLWLAQNKLSFRPFPLVLGHEGVGEVVAVGDAVTKRKVGDRVGVFMMQKACGVCAFCHEEHTNSFVTAANCANPKLTGVTVDGAFADYIAVDVGGTVLLPDGVDYEAAAPILSRSGRCCAGERRGVGRPAGVERLGEAHAILGGNTAVLHRESTTTNSAGPG